MRLATIRTAGGTRAVRVEDDRAVELRYDDLGALLADPDWAEKAAEAAGPDHALDEVDYAPVVPRPPKIICLGLNYRAHIEETGREVPQAPTLFAKFARALVGARDPITLPAVSDMVDWEVELAFVVGRTARHVPAEEAPGCIAGYTVLNDVSVRDYQNRTLQWLQGKTFEGSTPVGPVLVTPDECGDAADLRVRCEVDDEVVQDSRTSDLLFRPAEIVSYVSRVVTLEPGDLIATGTPGGVGHARQPPVYLRPGQVLRTIVEGIGECVNECVKERA